MSKATKKVRDKWRAKEWYSVFTPSYFGEMSVASIPVEDPKKLIGRVVETTLYEITNDFAHQSTKLYFLVVAKMEIDVYNESKKVCARRYEGVRKTKLLSMPLEAMGKVPEVKPVEEEIVAPIVETPSE